MKLSDPISMFVSVTGPVLVLDIGSGTQDVLLAQPETLPENWPQFVLPAPARRVASRLRELTAARTPVWLYGSNMGGGFAGAIKEHLAAGLPISISPDAASAIHDKPDQVRAMGMTIEDDCPPGYAPLYLTDFDPGFWNTFLAAAALPLPHLIAAAVQDHGVHADVGNREGRFRLWRELLARTQGEASRLIAPPLPACTRLLQLRRAIGGGPAVDTGIAAVLGALSVPEVRERSEREGILIVNVGNSHILAFLVYQERILGIYEHHTGLLALENLLEDLRQFRLGWLPDEQVRATGGHGCVFANLPPEAWAKAEGFRPAFILGPRRAMLASHGQFLAPHGDMMLTGCHGLLHGLAIQTFAR